MKSFGVCFLFVCYLTTIIVSEKIKNDEEIGKQLSFYCRDPLYTDGDVLVQAKTQFGDVPQSAKARSRAFIKLGGKRGNQFKNFMLSRETSKNAGSRVQKGSYIPVKSNGKREYFPPSVNGIYTGSDDIDLFQKWFTSYYLQ